MAQRPRDLTDDQVETKAWFHQFLESDHGQRTMKRVDELITRQGRRVVVNIADIREYSQENPVAGQANMADRLQQLPNNHLPYWSLALTEIVEKRAAVDLLQKDFQRRTCYVGIEGPMGTAVVTPRTLTSACMGQLVMVDGIVTRCSAMRPKMLESVHYSEVKNEWITKTYRDELSPFIASTHLPTVNVFPKRDADGNPLTTEYGLCTFIDHQIITLQEMPETAPVGQLPRSVEVQLEDDLTDSLKPGDRVSICGVYMAYTTRVTSKIDDGSIRFSTILVANNVIHFGKRLKEPTLSMKDKQNIHELQRTKTPEQLLKFLSEGIAPSIYGMDLEKQALLLMLLGGEERQLDHTRIRGDINILLVGEPSTGKSQLLRFVLNLAPLVINTTGRGSSGVGLTAAVTTDHESGEKTLSAGAMVLGDRGIVCIDEFDKMSHTDRVAMHEAMEQGSVTIAKAGIHASLNSRCSVLAAANPVYGFFMPQLRSANIGLPESLQSRFDLIFIVLDKGHSAEHNRMIASHVIENHTSAQPADKIQQTGPDSSIFGDASTSGSGSSAGGGLDNARTEEDEGFTSAPTEKFGRRKIVSVGFLRKYIQYAKSTVHPFLSPEASEQLGEIYPELRQKMKSREIDIRITPRTLENIIRLATAHAKMRLSETVERSDVIAVSELMKRTLSMTGHDVSTAFPPSATQPPGPTQTNMGPPPKRPRPSEASSSSQPPQAPVPTPTTGGPSLAEARQSKIITIISTVFRQEKVTQLNFFRLRDLINTFDAQHGGLGPADGGEIQSWELTEVLNLLQAQSKLVFDGGNVYLV